MTWLRPFSDYAEIYPAQIKSGWPLFQEKFSYTIRDDYADFYPLGNEMYPAICRLLQTRPSTVLHGDARMENVAFSDQSGPEGVRFYDWQLSCSGPAAYDLMYFLFQSINVEDWGTMGEALIDSYHAEIVSAGIVDYSNDELRRDLSLSVCLMLGFTSMVGNLLPNDESGHTVIKATMPRALNLFDVLELKKTLVNFKPT